MSVGDNIRAARINSGLNQKELAEKLNEKGIDVGNTTISNWENGTSKPNPDTIEAICNILGIDGNFILGFNAQINNSDDFDKLYSKSKGLLNESELDMIKYSMQRAIDRYEEEKSRKGGL